MKRSKVDVINVIVESFLKRRKCQDIESFRKAEESICINYEEMTVRGSTGCRYVRENSFTFSATVNDVDAADQAYQKLKHWIYEISDESLKTELKRALYAIFCLVYIEMLHAGNRQAAVQFFKTHQGDFISDTEKNFLEELSVVMMFQDIELGPLVNAFRTRKYKVDLSDKAHTCLQNYLSKYGNVILMQVINEHISVIKKITDSYPVENDNNEESSQHNDIVINGHIEQPCGIGVDREMRELQEAIRSLSNSAHQPLRIFTVKNAIENASSALITPNLDRLATGFHTSEIRLWAISDAVLMKPKFPNSPVFPRCDLTQNVSREDDNEKDEGGAIVMRGHTGVVHDMRFIPQLDMLATVSSDTTMRLWSMNDYSCAAVYIGHNYPVWCMDTSPHDWFVATGSHDRTTKLWSLDRTFPLRLFVGHQMDINCVRFHPNSRYIASGSSDKTVRLWSKDNGNQVRSFFNGAKSPIYSLAFSPNGQYIAAAGDDKSIFIWDMKADAQLTTLEGHQNSVMNLDWSPDGQYMVSSSLDGEVRFWPMQSHINAGVKSSLPNAPVENPQVYTTNCSSILSLRYYKKSPSALCIGTA